MVVRIITYYENGCQFTEPYTLNDCIDYLYNFENMALNKLRSMTEKEVIALFDVYCNP